MPSQPSHAAWVAAEPPGLASMSETVSLPLTTSPAGLTRMSLITSPQTTTRWLTAKTGKRDLPGERDVAAGQAQVHLEAGAARHPQDVVEQVRADRLAADSLVRGGPQ